MTALTDDHEEAWRILLRINTGKDAPRKLRTALQDSQVIEQLDGHWVVEVGQDADWLNDRFRRIAVQELNGILNAVQSSVVFVEREGTDAILPH